MSWLSKLGNVAASALADNLSASSEWGSLHPNLIAVISVCDVDGNPVAGGSVKAPIKDGTYEQSFMWQSPFDDMSPEKRNPRLTAQSASEYGAMLNKLTAGEDSALSSESGGFLDNAVNWTQDVLDKAQNRSGITKLNSRQVYAGHEPLKLSFTLVFRAFKDPYNEVEKPLQTLLQMAYPQKMADSYADSINTAAGAAKDAVSGESGGDSISKEKVVEAVFPSIAPVLVSFRYKGATYAPMVIESISHNLDDPHSITGDVFKEVQITLCSLHSLDATDVAKIKGSSLGSQLGGIAKEALNAATSLFK